MTIGFCSINLNVNQVECIHVQIPYTGSTSLAFVPKRHQVKAILFANTPGVIIIIIIIEGLSLWSNTVCKTIKVQTGI